MSEVSLRGSLLAIPVDFAIARTRIRFSHHALIEIVCGTCAAIGEGVLYRSTLQGAAELFRSVVRPALDSGLAEAPAAEQEVWLARLAAAEPGLAYAVDSALCDRQGRLESRPVADVLGGLRRTRIPITEQIFIRAWAQAERELDAIVRRGTRRIKVKIGTSPQADLEALRRVRAFVGDGVELRVDANRAYTLAEGEPLYRALAELGVLALEEPLAGRDWSALRTLRERVGLPVILDENVLSLADLQAAIEAHALDVLNVKLTRVGGPWLALGYARLCAEHGIEVALGCTEDLGVGTAAILHTAAALPALHSVEGVGPLRLGFDVVDREWSVVDGALSVPGGGGLGVNLQPAWRAGLPRNVRTFDMPGGLPLRAFSAYARWFQRANSALWRWQHGQRLTQRRE